MALPELFSNISKRELTKLLVENTPVAYIILDDNFQIHYINEHFLNLRNLKMDDVLGEKCYNLSNGGKPCNDCAVRLALNTSEKQLINRKDTLADGQVRFIDDYAIPLFHDDNTQLKYILEIMVNRSDEFLVREQRQNDFKEILQIMANLLETKDMYTATHSKSVGEISLRIAEVMNLNREELFAISIAAALHDIGKVRIPLGIINKPGKLSDEEFALIKKHPEISHEIIANLSGFDNVKQIVRHHHERFDGFGYPDRISGEKIPLGARIVAVADTYDAITSTRSYRNAMSHEYALEEITKNSGTQFDPLVVQALLEISWQEQLDYSFLKQKDDSTIERNINKNNARTEKLKLPERVPLEKISEESMLAEIFDNTPVGYVVMDRSKQVLFVNDYFLNYMGLTRNNVIGKRCYEISNNGNECPRCAMARSMDSRSMEVERIEQMTNNGLLCFDMFAMPFPDPKFKTEYYIEIIIDRTQEILLTKQREQDFYTLFNTLTNLIEEAELDNPNVAIQFESIKKRTARVFSIS